jgi:aspartyl-tRNA(Asn)/glutamyl-tRNA(Gln) amidotransferase subunit C
MSIERAEVERAARLARLALDERALDELARDLLSILEYVSVLEKAAGSSRALLLPPADVTRPDVPGGTLTQEEALANAARTRSGCFEVPGFLPDTGDDREAPE